MNGRDYFDQQGGQSIVNLGDWLAGRLPQDKLDAYAEICGSSGGTWEQAAVNGIVADAENTLRKRSVAIDVLVQAAQGKRKKKVAMTLLVLADDFSLVTFPEGVTYRRRRMTKALFDKFAIMGSAQAEEALGKALSCA